MVAFLPVCIFLFFCILYFIVLKAFEMYALAMGAFVALLISAVFTKKGHYDRFWEAVYDGAKEAIPVAVLLLIIGMFSAMIKAANISTGFVWLADKLHVGGGLFTAFTFFAVCIIASATGSSLGTMFTCFPIFYAAGILLGSNPAALAGAIVSGGIFGDNLAPISDTTIISAGTQEYTKKSGFAEILAGCRRSLFCTVLDLWRRRNAWQRRRGDTLPKYEPCHAGHAGSCSGDAGYRRKNQKYL